MRRCLLLLATLYLGSLGFGSALAPQDDPLARFRVYLERNPHHAQVFTRLVEEARTGDGLTELIEIYRREAEQESEGSKAAAHRIVLARLLAEDRQFDEASKLLAKITPPEAKTRQLLGQFQVRAGQLRQAVNTFAGAQHLSPDLELATELYLAQADLHLALGERDKASACFAKLLKHDEADLALIAEVCEQLAAAGDPDQAMEFFATTRERVEGDPEKLARWLLDLGGLCEGARAGGRALEHYDEALALVRGPHWLRRELLARTLELHRRAGTLDRFVSRARSELSSERGDLDTWMTLLHALDLAGRDMEAARILDRAIEVFPSDLKLADRRIEFLVASRQVDQELAERQRAIALAPAEHDRRFHLARRLAETGSIEAAERAFDEFLSARESGGSSLDRVVQTWTTLGENDRATRLLRRGVDQAPRDIDRVRRLVRLLEERALDLEAGEVLADAERAVRGHGPAMEALARLYLERENPTATERVLGDARAMLADGAPWSWRLSAEARALLEDRSGELEALLEGLGETREEGERAALIRGLVNGVENSERRSMRVKLLEREPENLSAGQYELLAEWMPRKEAHTLLLTALELHPEDLPLRRRLARAWLDAGQFDQGIAEYDALCQLEPRRTARLCMDLASYLIASKRVTVAVERLHRVAALPPRDAVTWRELSVLYDRAGRTEESLNCLSRALLIDPGDAPTQLALARSLKRHHRIDDAIAHYTLAWRHGELDVREPAADELFSLLEAHRRLRSTMREWRLLLRSDPYDGVTPRLLAEFARRAGNESEALRWIGELVRREGSNPELLRERAMIHAASGRMNSATRDLRELAEAGEDVDALLTRVMQIALDRKETGRAIDLGLLAKAPMSVASVLPVESRKDYLIRYRRKHGVLGEAAVWELCHCYRELERPRTAAGELEDLLDGPDDHWRVADTLGRIYHGLRDRQKSLKMAERLRRMGPAPALKRYLEDLDLTEDFTRTRTRSLARVVDDIELIGAGLEELVHGPYDRMQCLAFLQRLSGEAHRGSSHPDALHPEIWIEELHRWRLEVYEETWLDEPRVRELDRRRFALSASEWAELLAISPIQVPEGRMGPWPDADIDAAIKAFPGSAAVLIAGARRARALKRPSKAADLGLRALAVLERESEQEKAAVRWNERLRVEAQRIVENSLPHPLLSDPEVAGRLAHITLAPEASDDGRRMVPERREWIATLVSDLQDAGKPDEAAALMDRFPNHDPSALRARIHQADLLIQVGRTDEAQVQLDDIGAKLAAFEAEPAGEGVLGDLGPWNREVALALERAEASLGFALESDSAR